MRKKIILFNLLLLLAAFMAASPARANVTGLDVSRWQGIIDWDKAAPYAGFVMIKAGGGDEGFYVDPQFERNRQEVRRLGIPHGYYFYGGDADPLEQADYFASIVGPLEPGEVVALDFEIPSNDPVVYSWMFLFRTEQRLGTKPLLYTNMNRVWDYNWTMVVENGNRLWGAIYDDDPGNMPLPRAWQYTSIKQFTSSGQIPGISTPVDVNSLGPGVSFESLAMTVPQPAPAAPKHDEAAAPAPPKPIEVPKEVTQQAASGESINSAEGQTQTDIDSNGQTPAQEDVNAAGAGTASTQAQAQAQAAGQPAGDGSAAGGSTAKTDAGAASDSDSPQAAVIHHVVMGPIAAPLTEPVTHQDEVRPSLLDPLLPMRNLEVAVNKLVNMQVALVKK